MEYEQLAHTLLGDLKLRLENNPALSIFVKERKRFEGWIKVELCEILLKHFDDILPENEGIDVTFDQWALELKPVATNYTYPGVKTKTKNITNNVDDIIRDVAKLKARPHPNKAVLFVVFPVDHANPGWRAHLNRISRHLRQVKHENFRFVGDIPGVLYFGLV